MTPTEARTVTLTDEACDALVNELYERTTYADERAWVRQWVEENVAPLFSTHTREMVRDAERYRVLLTKMPQTLDVTKNVERWGGWRRESIAGAELDAILDAASADGERSVKSKPNVKGLADDIDALMRKNGFMPMGGDSV